MSYAYKCLMNILEKGNGMNKGSGNVNKLRETRRRLTWAKRRVRLENGFIAGCQHI